MENKLPLSSPLARLKAQLEAAAFPRENQQGPGLTIGAEEVDKYLENYDVAAASLHEIYAENHADAVTAHAFALGVAARAAAGKPIVWALQDMLGQEAGHPYGPGLHAIGLAPRDLLLVRVRDAPALLAVAEEALRNRAVGVTLLSAWGENRAFTATASRRLKLAARKSGVMALFARAAAIPAPSAAETRWSVRAVASTPLEADAPSRPTFSATLLRHRGGGASRTWIMEWDRECRAFREPAPLSGDLVSLPPVRSSEAAEEDNRRRRAG